ncbi:MAG: cell division protein FtsA [Chloracidobacterium sp.]|uniref:Cell division protein FtsA n=1 Tax=Chloracidobacterium validum TaxID=2821543 RepID=A0ABX8B9C8_9BACT|nr:cell division protein FtsA [Chloracidobacterium validum]QUW03536.1 cell division protein FtsA [Chloracidobacterium validum]
MARGTPYTASLDLGSTRTRIVIATPVPDRDRWTVAGYADVPSKGMRKGVVVNIELVEETIRQALTEAEKMAGIEVSSVHASLSGMHVRGLNGHGVVAVSHRNRQITAADVQRVIEQASAISLPSDRGIVEVLPQEFVVDEQDGIGDPLGMLGMRLEVTIHIVTSPVTASQNIVTSANRLGMIVEDLTLGSLAAATATLTDEEREYGTAIVDIGGEITSLAVFQRGAVRHTAMFGIGGTSFTNDIAVGLRSSVPEAERIKQAFGCAFAPLLHPDERQEQLEFAASGGRPRLLSRHVLCDMLQPRAEEIFKQLQENIREAGLERKLSSGLVLTGGGSLLSGIPELAERMLDVPVRIGTPTGLDGLNEELRRAEWATSIGLILSSIRPRANHHLRQRETGWRDWLTGIKNFFSSPNSAR